MRRSDREVTGRENILSILDKCEVMRLGLCADDMPYVVPMNFAYQVADEIIYIYFHCALEGKKTDIIAKNNNVCFEADCSYKTLKGKLPCAWSAEFESVIGEGRIMVITGEQQKIDALNLLMRRYGFDGEPSYGSRELSAVNVLRVTVTSMTGKRRDIKC